MWIVNLLSKLLARRLESLLPQLINPGPDRFYSTKVVTFQCQETAKHNTVFTNIQNSSACHSLDAEKAFKPRGMAYMFEVLDKFNLGTDFINWIQTLYCCTNCLRYYQWPSLSSFFVGARYKAGLPAVPSPFALILEPLQRLLELTLISRGLR